MPQRRPLFVTAYATIWSTLYFGISIFAITVVWLNLWHQSVPQIPSRKKNARRRSAPPTLQSSTKASAQSEPATSSIMASTTKASPVESITRRVYFIDSQMTTPRRSNSVSHPATVDTNISPFSSSSTLVSSVSQISVSVPPTLVDVFEDSAVESDHPSKKNPRTGFQLPKLLSRVHRKAPSNTGVEGYTSQSDSQATIAPVKRASTANGICVQKNWTLSRTRTTVVEVESPDRPPRMFRFPGVRVVSTPTPTPNNSSSPHLPSRHQRRTSSTSKPPVPRTQPYAAPYFAALPGLPLNRSPEAVQTDSERTSRPTDFRGRDRRQVNAQAQASLGIGRPLHKRRSASESWVTKGAIAPLDCH